MRRAGDLTAEFRVAAALASLGWQRRTDDERLEPLTNLSGIAKVEGFKPKEDDADDRPSRSKIHLPFCVHLAPLDQRQLFASRRRWNEERTSDTLDGTTLAVWGAGDLLTTLIAVLERRLMEAERHGLDDKPLDGRLGVDLGTIEAFIAGPPVFDDRRCAAMVAGLAWAVPPRPFGRRKQVSAGLSFAYAALKPIFAPNRALRKIGALPAESRLPVPPRLVRALASGRVGQALRMAVARARGSGLPILFDRASAKGIDPRRLAAALLIPLEQEAILALCERAYPSDEKEGDNRDAA